MHILVTNDDGVFAPGLLALAQAMQSLGKVSILAPDRNWSACGHVKTMTRPLRVNEVSLADGIQAFACDGAPSDCVALALMGVIKEPIDLVVSGINPNANIGLDLTYSGTVMAAMEASINGVMGIAVSLDTSSPQPDPLNFASAAETAARLSLQLWENNQKSPRLPFWNINIPYRPQGDYAGVQFTRQGVRIYQDALEERIDPRGKAYYWIGGDQPTGRDETGTDFGALVHGYVSVTPLSMDLTDHQILEINRQTELFL